MFENVYTAKLISNATFLVSLSLCTNVLNAKQHSVDVTFKDISLLNNTNINYVRKESATQELINIIRKKDILLPFEAALVPANNHGSPGVAILDYDNDGDMDIYVTNGPGKNNSLYSNQLIESKKISFIDVGIEAGVGAIDMDSTGVCYGDIDNDGDDDLMVLGISSSDNRLFENIGNGKFEDISQSSNISGYNRSSSTCSMGDINGDGLLDIAIANSWHDWSNRIPLMTHQANHLIEDNQLFLNTGSRTFKDVSFESGILNTEAHVTWSIALVDYDQDGDVDLFMAEDHGPRLPARHGGIDMGFVRVYNNDGTGKFTEFTTQLGLTDFGGYMSLSFGDVNHDGIMDFFASNVGDYSSFATAPMLGFPKVKGEWGSNWYLGNEQGGITRMGSGQIGATVFGWGSAITDYDNDGDSDIIYHGGLDFVFFQDGSNPGVVLNNDGTGKFNRDDKALKNSVDHRRRNTKGVSVGDLNLDGFVDIVSVSNQNWPDNAPMAPYPDIPIGGQFDDALLWPTYRPVDQQDITKGFIWNGIEEQNGTLSVELNNAENKYNSITVSTQGSIGLLDNGKVNRSGIGAVVKFTPNNGITSMRPYVSGGTFASQHSSNWVFGMGESESGVLDVLWPGGNRNRLYNVRAGETVMLSEIPCSYKDENIGIINYYNCVSTALKKLSRLSVINKKEASRYMSSSIRAYIDENNNHKYLKTINVSK